MVVVQVANRNGFPVHLLATPLLGCLHVYLDLRRMRLLLLSALLRLLLVLARVPVFLLPQIERRRRRPHQVVTLDEGERILIFRSSDACAGELRRRRVSRRNIP